MSQPSALHSDQVMPQRTELFTPEMVVFGAVPVSPVFRSCGDGAGLVWPFALLSAGWGHLQQLRKGLMHSGLLGCCDFILHSQSRCQPFPSPPLPSPREAQQVSTCGGPSGCWLALEARPHPARVLKSRVSIATARPALSSFPPVLLPPLPVSPGCYLPVLPKRPRAPRLESVFESGICNSTPLPAPLQIPPAQIPVPLPYLCRAPNAGCRGWGPPGAAQNTASAGQT